MGMHSLSAYRLKTSLAATVLFLGILCLLSYLMAPAVDRLTLSLFNPMEVVHGMAFFMGFGLGFSSFFSYLLVAILLIAFWFFLFGLIRNIWKET